MLKYVGLLCGVLFVFAGCATMPACMDTGSASDPYKKLVADLEASSMGCSAKAFEQTRVMLARYEAMKKDPKQEYAACKYFNTVLAKYNEEKANSANAAAMFAGRVNDFEARKANVESKIDMVQDELDSFESSSIRRSVLNMLDDVDADVKAASDASNVCDFDVAFSKLDMAEEKINNIMAEVGSAKMATMDDSYFSDYFEYDMNGMDEYYENSMKSGDNRRYIVKRGDSLWKISTSEYKDPYMWSVIFYENQSLIKNPHLIYPGQALEIKANPTAMDKANALDLAKPLTYK